MIMLKGRFDDPEEFMTSFSFFKIFPNWLDHKIEQKNARYTIYVAGTFLDELNKDEYKSVSYKNYK